MADMSTNSLPMTFRVPGSPVVAPGEICNEQGDIEGARLGASRTIITQGIVWVTPEQAERARRFGWQMHGNWPNDAELVQVAR